MNINFSPLSLKKQNTLVIPIFEDQPLDKNLPKELQTEISRFQKTDLFQGKKEQVFYTYIKTPKLDHLILLMGVGKGEELNKTTLRYQSARVAKQAKGLKVSELTFLIPPALNTYLEELVLGTELALYEPAKFKSKTPEKKENKGLETITFVTQHATEEQKNSTKLIQLITEQVNLVRDLVNAPHNLLNTKILAEKAEFLGKKSKLKVRVLNRRQLEKLNMGALLGVNQGSADGTRMVILEYIPHKASKVELQEPTVLVGKGITFDSGGYNLKPTGGISNMKMDMAGAAAVLGVLTALPKLNLRKRVIGVMPMTDNLIGPNAQKVNDIVTSFTGKTIEITNTDAEGRLILADAIAFAIKEFKPKKLIDIATLTGACVVALGDRYAGVIGNDQQLIESLRKAGEETDEQIWQLPLHPDFTKAMKGKISDLQNSDDSGAAGASKGAAFLQEFVGKTSWAHLDIAGVAHVKDPKPFDHVGATGFGVRLLLEFLQAN